MKLTTSLGAVTVLFFAWVAGCGDESSSNQPGGMAGAGDAGEPAAGGAANTAGATSGSSTGGTENSAGDAAGGAAGAGMVAPCELAADWEVVDDYAVPGATRTQAVDVVADSAGNLYVIGLVLGTGDPIMPRGAVRRSTDGGETWTDLSWDLDHGIPNDAATDDAGNIFVAAGVGVAGTPVVFKSDDQGASFDSVFEIPRVSGGVNDPCNTGFVAAGTGGVVVAGASCDHSNWVVVKSEDSGVNLEAVFTFNLSPGKPARMHDVGVDDDGVAYVIGNAADSNDAIHWITVREGEPTGVVSDDFTLVDNAAAEPRGFVSRGTPMVAGFASDGNVTHGIVRRMTAPDTWETIDQFSTRGSDVEAVGDHFIVSGDLEDTTGIGTVTRRTDDAGANWDPIGEFTYAAGHNTVAGSLGSDPAGNFYSLSAGHDADDVPRWIVRKLACE